MSKLWIFEAFKSIFQKSFSFKMKIQPTLLARCTRIYTQNRSRETDRQDPAGQLTPPVSQTRAGLAFDRRDLTVGEVVGDEVTTIVIIVPRRTRQCNGHGQRCTEVTSSACMAAWRLGSPAGARLRPWGGAGSGVGAPPSSGGARAREKRARRRMEGRGPRSGAL